ncbi:MAG: hypothetical protein IK137_00570 [Bacilli bacterium]|nr:hypothetical protein [Bacilli bacterium]
MNRDLVLIKRHYGEKMMHLCRELFPEVLEKEGLLYKTLINSFFPSRSLCDDIINNQAENKFKKYILFKTGYFRESEVVVKNGKTPQELLSEAGYDLYECKTEEDVQSFKKYFAPGEELCTFRGGRLNRAYVFFAVKKNVDEIKRKNFKKPKRQDEYGTSVMSIQFNRGDYNWVSIKNRYNHTVTNPDSTFNNNLDNIISGLSNAFIRDYGFVLDKKESISFELPNYVKHAGKYYKYIFERDGIYYCGGNVVIDWNGVHELDRSKYLVTESFILNLETKGIKKSFNYSFVASLGKIKNIKITRDRENSNKIITINGDTEIVLNRDCEIISYTNPNVTEVSKGFLSQNRSLKVLDLPNLRIFGDCALSNNIALEYINIPHVIKVGDYFLSNNNKLEDIDWPQIKYVGSNCLMRNHTIKAIRMPNIVSIQAGFLIMNDLARKTLYRRIKHNECYNLAKQVRKIDKHDIKFYYKALA